MTIAEARRKFSLQPKSREFPEYDWGAFLNYLLVSASFDSRIQWPECIHPIQNDDGCYGGWAYAAIEIF
ncbi:unnamed protein product [Blepharisma stoltei]|uniref:DUF1911 domain-containing protein n=1 Tax=Blepharisma stoltei TaxID=1481888 RepID=A0AAU9IHL9_9CILI|nr:unnamed protein product [Blepharisma stoltei]